MELRGTAGAEFGAFLARGIELNLTGESNDYTGKGLSAEEFIVEESAGDIDRQRTSLSETACLYGATGGEAYINGVAGERFAVRNCGAYAVIERREWATMAVNI